jgi:hypothetical protein
VATIDPAEFEELCREFSAEKRIGLDSQLVRMITLSAIALCEGGQTVVLAMYKALDLHSIDRKIERKLYCEVMVLYLGRHGFMGKRRKPYETKRDRAWRNFARRLNSQGQLKFK